ncbi:MULTISPECIES: DUF817 domain-containing protein [Paenibacillus]|uniref:DUF817 domain-containing protein n=1 Tax=Paenibacillus TaxID=44249 RepID=UPI0004F79126|nr:DUF817 domain-containing protein [Paenibacillus odorifer]AIQ74306.1 hypothetical protein PODO_14170 [Paenibacillus odorifer]MEC0133549.1 DUF817 domain-containing protein [Paenibacillus odorifer]MEC0224868.1 DUF817 domain-containing protein [Paenibacillus odorifer]OMC96568.1 hypothetical protein BJP46_04580 [Paenibacillus odorifer]OMD03904.1 hypothetical protein BJP49_03685 [Paenibacillus odorifer]
MKSITQLLHFGYHQAMSCIFPIAIFGTLALSNIIEMPFLYRYDAILLILLTVQYLMYRTGLETLDEIKVICVFHVIGLLLEIYKVKMGSWAYPEPGFTKVFGVPLYSGFMYASVASFMCQIWRRLKMDMTGWPGLASAGLLGGAIYLNFFTHHFIPDFRWWLTALVVVVFWKTWIIYRVRTVTYRMPLTLAFFIVGFFIWLAENIATFFNAWKYPDQYQTWQLVSFSKISSWFLLVIISVIIVAQLKHVKASRNPINS